MPQLSFHCSDDLSVGLSDGGAVGSGGSGVPQTDHTTGSKDGYYLSLSRNGVQRAGDRALLFSREMEGSSQETCLSFWYYMHEPIVDNTGPNLGKLSAWVRSTDK